jgi:hypothetical protein
LILFLSGEIETFGLCSRNVVLYGGSQAIFGVKVPLFYCDFGWRLVGLIKRLQILAILLATGQVF